MSFFCTIVTHSFNGSLAIVEVDTGAGAESEGAVSLFRCKVVLHSQNGHAEVVVTKGYNDKEPVVSIAEYRKLLNDNTTSDDRIRARIEYLEAFCRNIARAEIEAYVKNIKATKKV